MEPGGAPRPAARVAWRARIRAAVVDDAARLAWLAGELGYPSTPAAVARRMRAIGEHAAGVVLVAPDARGVPRGFVHVLVQRFVIAEPFAELVALVVAADQRGTGIGTALVAAAEDWSRDQGVRELWVRANVVRERTHGFYRRAGFAECKRQAVFVRSLVAGEE